MPSITVKWGKEKYTVDADVAEPPLVFKSQLFALTGVAPERQKVMIKVIFLIRHSLVWQFYLSVLVRNVVPHHCLLYFREKR